ncbi:MAG: serine hydrolase [Sedimentisphaerales bacterium]|nr:serine hydrolase [Sedimentisphaerales bacterium]
MVDKGMSLKKSVLTFLTIAALCLPAQAAEKKKAGPRGKGVLSNASYRGLRPGKFMTKWLILGPVPVFADEAAGKGESDQKKAFETDPFSLERFRAKVKIGDKQYEWSPLVSESDVVDLDQALGQKEYATAYAWARINVVKERKVLLGIGSDDAVKIWLNGELVHENWVQRPCAQDSDLVGVTFRKGRNHLVLKVQNGTSDWGFSCRVLGAEALGQKLVSAVGSGHLDPVKTLLEHSIDVNAKVGPGLTALHMARITGRTEAAKLLLDGGADAGIPMPPKERIVDWLFERLVEENYPGAAVLVARNGEILYQNGYGYANISDCVEITPQTKFRIGSISKQFTAAAILKLQEEGKLSTDDKLSKFLPDFPRGDEVTLHHLLTHTSGIHSYTSDPNFMKTVASETSPKELIDSFKNDKFDFEPGESQSYCNSGYFLLGHIVAKVSGKSFGDYLKETFFDPLGMADTGIYHWSLVLDHEAVGYSYQNGQVQKALDWDMSRAGGAGALYSTVEDLYRWNEAVFKGKILSEASLKAAFTPAALNSGEAGKGTGVGSEGYGYGWGIGTLRGRPQIAHSGGLHGFISYLMRLPEEELTVAVLANCLPTVPELSTSGLGRQIAEIYLHEEMDEQTSFATDTTVDPAVYDDYVGRYDYGNSMVLTVTREGNRLLAQLTGQGQAEIFPRSETEFFWEGVDAQIRFVRDETGTVTGAVHQQGGARLEVAKLKDEPVADIDPAVYDAYVGDYELENVGTMKIVKEGGRLFGKVGGQPQVELFPRSQTEFFLKIAQVEIIFNKDPDGSVTSLTLKQAGMTLTGKKVQ